MESNHEELVVRLLQLVLGDGNDGKKREVSKVAEMLDELKNGIDREKLEKILKELEEIKKEKGGDVVNKLELKVKESPKLRKEYCNECAEIFSGLSQSLVALINDAHKPNS